MLGFGGGSRKAFSAILKGVSKGSSWRLLEVILRFSWLILALLGGPSGPKIAFDKMAEIAQDCPKMDPRLRSMAQDGRKIAQTGPRWPKMDQAGPRWCQGGPRWPEMTPGWPKTAQDGPRCPKIAPRYPQMAPRWPEVAPRSSHHFSAVHVASFRPPPAQVYIYIYNYELMRNLAIHGPES